MDKPEVNDHTKDVALRYCHSETPGAGTVAFDCCPRCGSLKWISSSREPAGELRVVLHSVEYVGACRACNEISRPEDRSA